MQERIDLKTGAARIVHAVAWFAAGVATTFAYFEWMVAPSPVINPRPSKADVTSEALADKFDRAGVLAVSALHQRSEADRPTEYKKVRVDGLEKAFVPNPYQGSALAKAESIRRLPDMAGVKAGEAIDACAKTADASLMASLVWEMSRGETWSVGAVGGDVLASTTRRGAEALVADLRKKGKNINVGLLQLNTRTLARYGVTPEEALEPCVNLQIAADRLSTLYEEALKRMPAGGPMAAQEAVNRFRAENYRSAPVPLVESVPETAVSRADRMTFGTETGVVPPVANGETGRTPQTSTAVPASSGQNRGSGLIF